ncbi:hemicentin-2-like isoform X2 [Mya arenaria]|uniref:hemicentin-2-like isoform X2 n=1 Tax=Mya arenaria TaxID=6604 RepID=UPI0022E47370|nr:hemicentin-2-like isoform X2 [Mya arenaria]
MNSTWIAIIILCLTGSLKAWTCPSNSRVFTDVGGLPILTFTATNYESFDFVAFQITTWFGNLLTVNYEYGRVYAGSPYLHNCTLAEDADLDNGILSIQLINTRQSEGGTYRLIKQYIGIETVQCITLYILGIPTLPLISYQKHPQVGKNLTLSSSSRSTTFPSNHSLHLGYQWFQRGQPISIDGRYTFDSLNKSITIINVSRSDHNSNTSCVAKEEGGKASEKNTFVLNVFFQPVISPTTNRTQIEGSPNVTLECLFESNPRSTLRWYKRGSDALLFEDEVSLGRNTSFYIIRSLNRDHAGIYRCIADNGIGADEAVITLDVQYPPEVVVEAFNTSSDSLTSNLTCKANGVPNKYRYMGWNQQWPGHGVVNVWKDAGYNLVLNQLSYEYSGVYSCSASNGISLYGDTKTIVESSTYFVVRDKPVVTFPVSAAESGLTTITDLASGFAMVNLHVYSNDGPISIEVTKGQDNEKKSVKGNIRVHYPEIINLPVFGRKIAVNGSLCVISVAIETDNDFGLHEILIRNNYGTINIGWSIEYMDSGVEKQIKGEQTGGIGVIVGSVVGTVLVLLVGFIIVYILRKRINICQKDQITEPLLRILSQLNFKTKAQEALMLRDHLGA